MICKFRAWNGKEMYSPLSSDILFFTQSKPLTQYFDNNGDIKSSSVMLWTVLKDKQGIDIYEGDIVYIADIGDCEVKFENGSFLFDGELYQDVIEDIERIVGNIYK